MATFAYEDRETSFVRSTVLVLAIAATAYVAGALLQFPVSSHDASVTFSQPVQAAEPMFRARTPGADTVPPHVAEFRRRHRAQAGDRLIRPLDDQIRQRVDVWPLAIKLRRPRD